MSRSLCLLTSRLLRWTESFDVHLDARYLPGESNVLADVLSRRGQVVGTEWSLHPQVARALLRAWGNPSIDLPQREAAPVLLACPGSPGRLRGCISPSLGRPGSVRVPSFPLVGRVIARVQESSRVAMTLVAPLWPEKEWFADLLLLLTQPPLALPCWDKLLRQPHCSLFHQGVHAQTPGFRLIWSPRRLFLELFASVRFRLWLLPLPLLFFSSCACLVSSETAASRMLTVTLAPDAERAFAFGCSFCSVSGSAPSSLVASWCDSLGACLPFVPCLFLWNRCHSRVNGRGAGEVLPIGSFPLSVFGVALPPLWRWQTREAESCGPFRSSGRLLGACSSLSSSPLTLPGVVLTFPVCLPRAPALRQVLVAMLAEGTLESPSVLVLAFHSSLFLVEGSSDGSAPGDRSSPLGRCVHSHRFV